MVCYPVGECCTCLSVVLQSNVAWGGRAGDVPSRKQVVMVIAAVLHTILALPPFWQGLVDFPICSLNAAGPELYIADAGCCRTKYKSTK